MILLLAVVTFARFTSLPMASLVAFVLLRHDDRRPATATVDLVQASYVVVIGLLLLPATARNRVARCADTSDSDHPGTATLPRELRSVEVVQFRCGSAVSPSPYSLLGGPFPALSGKTLLMIDTFVFGMVAVSLLVLTGWGGQVSLAEFGFTAIGASGRRRVDCCRSWSQPSQRPVAESARA